MKMMTPLFLATVLLSIGISSAKPGTRVEIPPVGQTRAPIFQLTLPPEVLIKWNGPVIDLIETFMTDGPTSMNTQRELLRLIIEIFVDRGFIGLGYPVGVPFPCADYEHVRIFDYVFITDGKNVLNVVPYDDSYAPILTPQPKALLVGSNIVVLFAEAILNILVTGTTSAD